MTKQSNERYDVIVVLGAQVRPEGVPSEALRRRLALALERYEARRVPVICCGAQAGMEPCTEGDFMCGWLVDHGAAPEDMISENKSYDTLQNIRNAKVIMQERGFTRALVITSDYHVRRALATCRRYGVEAEGAGSPSLPAYWLKNHFRELLAWVKFYIFR